jgi:chromosome segregation ATPase
MERLRAQELEANLDRLCVAASRKAAGIDRQRSEFEAAAAAHATLQAAHGEAAARGAALGARVAELERDLSGERRLASGLRQGLADKERQVAALTAEVERLSGRPLPPGGDGEVAAPPGGGLDAAAVIDTRLVTFRSLGQLVEKNSQLLAVARGLADDLEASRVGLEARYAEARASEAAETERRIAELTEMCSSLAAEAAACKRAADEALRDRQARDQDAATGGGGGAGGGASAAELEAARKRVAELEGTVSQLRSDAAESSALLRQQLEAARGAEAASRGEAASARAQHKVLANASAALQQQLADAQARGERLAAQLTEQRGLVERLEGQLEDVSGCLRAGDRIEGARRLAGRPMPAALTSHPRVPAPTLPSLPSCAPRLTSPARRRALSRAARRRWRCSLRTCRRRRRAPSRRSAQPSPTASAR